ncbi:MAG TPA: hypothetical protein VMF67_15995 [Rhizomicrobium sp.]|nr:hypothetical protein [Rhizomicrobium sp.]
MPFFLPETRSASGGVPRSASICVAAALLCCAAVLPASAAPAPHKVGLGKVLTSSDGQEIYGFDIDQNGNDGVLATAGSVETFNQDTGKITKTFATKNTAKNSYSADGIFSGDVGLVTHYITPKGQFAARRVYDVMNPVTANKFTGTWTPPVKDIQVELVAENQATSNSVVFAIELKKQDVPDLIVSDVAANTFSKVIHLDPNLFSLGNGPQLGQYAAANQAVIAESPDDGEVGGAAPVNYLFDLTTGKSTQFNGYNNGPYGAGDVNGLATDPNTGMTATDTELNAQVEFYDMASQSAITAVQLPCTSDTAQLDSGSTIAIDPVNKLFLVNEPVNACTNSGSAIVVYDESGNYVETIDGFQFAGNVIIFPAPILNPSKRIGWVFGGPNGSVSQLQQFFY